LNNQPHIAARPREKLKAECANYRMGCGSAHTCAIVFYTTSCRIFIAPRAISPTCAQVVQSLRHTSDLCVGPHPYGSVTTQDPFHPFLVPTARTRPARLQS
ncbi:unnamed protein product, partial [Pylaiella littoralis]